MQRYNINNRLAYLSGGVQSAGGMWPSTASDWWDVAGETCVAAYQPKGAASQAASYVNLANPGTYDATLTDSGGFSWNTSTGWTFTGSTGRLNSGVTPSATTWSYIVRFTAASRGGADFGRTYDSGSQFMMPRTSSGHYYGNGSNKVEAGETSSGVMAIADRACYLDGSADGADLAASAATGGAIYIGNRSGGDRGLDGTIIALAIYSTTLDASQISDLTTAMNAL